MAVSYGADGDDVDSETAMFSGFLSNTACRSGIAADLAGHRTAGPRHTIVCAADDLDRGGSPGGTGAVLGGGSGSGSNEREKAFS